MGDVVKLKALLNCRVLEVYENHSYLLLCEQGILIRRFMANDMDRLETAIEHSVPDYNENLPRITFRVASKHLSDSAKLTRIPLEFAGSGISTRNGRNCSNKSAKG